MTTLQILGAAAIFIIFVPVLTVIIYMILSTLFQLITAAMPGRDSAYNRGPKDHT